MKRTLIEQLLPEVFQRTIRPGNPLTALLEVMETLHAPSEEVLADLAGFFGPYRAPDSFVPYLASWVDLERFLVRSAAGDAYLPSGLGRLRELIAAAAYLSQWRGTAKGLKCFLETATGIEGFAIDEQVVRPDGHRRPFHISIRVPVEAEQYWDLIKRIIEMEKPAYITYGLALVQ